MWFSGPQRQAVGDEKRRKTIHPDGSLWCFFVASITRCIACTRVRCVTHSPPAGSIVSIVQIVEAHVGI